MPDTHLENHFHVQLIRGFLATLLHIASDAAMFVSVPEKSHSQQPFTNLSPPCFTQPDLFLVSSHQLSLFVFASIFRDVSAALLWKLLTQQPSASPLFHPHLTQHLERN